MTKNFGKGKSQWSRYNDEAPAAPAAPAATPTPTGEPAAAPAAAAPTPTAPPSPTPTPTPTPAPAPAAVTPTPTPAPSPTPAAPATPPSADDDPKALKAANEKLAQEKADLEKKLAEKEQTTMTVEEQLKALQAKQEQDRKDLEERLRLSNLQAFKEKALREAGDELILDLVGGNTEEEVTASIERAKTAYKNVYEKGVEAAKAVTPAAPAGGVPAATKPESAPTTEVSLDAVPDMSMDDYAKNRSALLKKAGSMYGQG